MRSGNAKAYKTKLECAQLAGHQVASGLFPELCEQSDEVLQAEEVAVFVVALRPRRPMVHGDARRQRRGVAEVNQPDTRVSAAVMDEEQRTADHLRRESRHHSQLLSFASDDSTSRSCAKHASVRLVKFPEGG